MAGQSERQPYVFFGLHNLIIVIVCLDVPLKFLQNNPHEILTVAVLSALMNVYRTAGNVCGDYILSFVVKSEFVDFMFAVY